MSFRGETRQLRPLDVPRLRSADRRRPRAVGISEEAGVAAAQGREGHARAARCATARCRSRWQRWATSIARCRTTRSAPRWKRPTTCSRSSRTWTARRASARSCVTAAATSSSTVRGDGPAALELFHHALAPVADLPVLEVLSAMHIVSRPHAQPRDRRARLPRARPEQVMKLEGQDRHRHRRGERHRQGHRHALRAAKAPRSRSPTSTRLRRTADGRGDPRREGRWRWAWRWTSATRRP